MRRIWLYVDEFEALSRMLESTVDSFGKLELVVELFRSAPQRRGAHELAKRLSLDPFEALEALAALRSAGVVAMEARGDEVTWWFDLRSRWKDTIDCLSELHELDRDEVLDLMKHVAVQHFRAGDTTDSMLSFAKRKRGKEAAA